MTVLLGLTGNIACGKSTVGRYLAERYAAEYVDADRVVHALYTAGTEETRRIAERFGAGLLQEDGTIDRRRLGDVVMTNVPARLELEQILEPGIRRAIERRVAESRARVLVLDAIRLIEAGWAERCDAVWVVTCERPAQLARLMDSRNMTRDQAELRVDAQSPQAEKVRRATTVLSNDLDPASLLRQVDEAWRTEVLPRVRAGHGSRVSPTEESASP